MENINHGEYQKRLRNASPAALRYIISDCREAIKAMPDGQKAGYYADEISYAGAELRRRAYVTT